MTSPYSSAPVTGISIDPFRLYYINDLIPEGGPAYRWGGTLSNTPLDISYSFPQAGATWSQDPFTGYGGPDDPHGGPDEPLGEPWHGFQALNTTQQQAFRDALHTWQDVANINFVEVSDTANDVGDIRVAGSAVVTHSDAAAWAYYPYPGTPTSGARRGMQPEVNDKRASMAKARIRRSRTVLAPPMAARSGDPSRRSKRAMFARSRADGHRPIS